MASLSLGVCLAAQIAPGIFYDSSETGNTERLLRASLWSGVVGLICGVIAIREPIGRIAAAAAALALGCIAWIALS
jgi:hypothetical protein